MTTTPPGEVVSFDDAKGYGQVQAADGRELFLHCTAIAAGTRTIPVGAPVAFTVAPGRWEARDVTVLRASRERDGPLRRRDDLALGR